MNERGGDKKNLRLWKLCIFFGAGTLTFSVGFIPIKIVILQRTEYKDSNVKVLRRIKKPALLLNL